MQRIILKVDRKVGSRNERYWERITSGNPIVDVKKTMVQVLSLASLQKLDPRIVAYNLYRVQLSR